MAITYAQCKDKKDLHELLYDEKYPIVLVRKASPEIDLKRRQRESAEKIWQEILAQHQHKMDENGFIEVGVDERKEIYIKTGRPGRPMKLEREAVKEKKISVRLDQETYKKLEEYSKNHNIPVSEAARMAIQNHVNKPKIELLKL